MKNIILALIVVVPFLIQPALGVETLPKQRSAAQIDWQRLAGRVERCDNTARNLTLRDRNGNVAFVRVDEDVLIFRHWRLVAFNEIQPQDHIILKRPR